MVEASSDFDMTKVLRNVEDKMEFNDWVKKGPTFVDQLGMTLPMVYLMSAAPPETEVLRLILSATKDISINHAHTINGSTALIVAACNEATPLESFKLLVEAGANVNDTDNYAESVFAKLSQFRKDYKEIANYLVEKGAVINSVQAESIAN